VSRGALLRKRKKRRKKIHRNVSESKDKGNRLLLESDGGKEGVKKIHVGKGKPAIQGLTRSKEENRF